METITIYYEVLLALSLLGLLKGWKDWEMKNNSSSWENKYKNPLTPAPGTWYYKAFNLKYKERFPLSATQLVFLTDAWHFAGTLEILTLISILLFLPQIDVLNALLCFPARKLGFHFMYSWLLPRIYKR